MKSMHYTVIIEPGGWHRCRGAMATRLTIYERERSFRVAMSFGRG